MNEKSVNQKEPLLAESTAKVSAGQGISFFRGMPKPIRRHIASYLSEEDLARLSAVSRDFHGTFHTNYAQEYSEKFCNTVWGPINECLPSENASTETVVLGSTLAALCLLPTVLISSGYPFALVAGFMKDVLPRRFEGEPLMPKPEQPIGISMKRG